MKGVGVMGLIGAAIATGIRSVAHASPRRIVPPSKRFPAMPKRMSGTGAREAGSYRGARRKAARIVAKQNGAKLRAVWPNFRMGGQ